MIAVKNSVCYHNHSLKNLLYFFGFTPCADLLCIKTVTSLRAVQRVFSI